MWAVIFPGQGSQHVGMGKYLFDEFSTARFLFEEASDLLQLNFKKLCFDGPEDLLRQTENTQPALLLVSVATYRVLNEIAPCNIKAFGGHSVGEYAALVAAHALSFEDAIRAVRIRGQEMQSAVPIGEGGMVAAVGLEAATSEQVCTFVESQSGFRPLEPANFNSPAQTVLSGNLEAIQWLMTHSSDVSKRCQLGRIKWIPLNVSAPFHCSLMYPAEKSMESTLKSMTFSEAQIPIVQNFNAELVFDPDELRKNLVRQISKPVRWVECMQQIKSLGVSQLIESGPGKVLAGLAKKIDDSAWKTYNTIDLQDLKALESKLSESPRE